MEAQTVRVQKFLADAGVCSRRAAEALVAASEVWVNGVCAKPGQPVTPGVDKVVVSGKPIRSVSQPRITVAVNKPRGLICSNDDPYNPETVFALLPRELAKLRFFCAGRLDKDSEGLVILTTDGDLANRLMRPAAGVIKRYHISLKDQFPAARLGTLIKGVVVEGDRLKVERAALVNAGPDAASRELDVHMQHGRKREIRQLFAAKGILKTRVIPGKEAEGAKFKDYFDWSEPIAGAPSHRYVHWGPGCGCYRSAGRDGP